MQVEPKPAPLLFLSHAGADTEAARALKRRIEQSPIAQASSLKVWFDKDDLQAGQEWQAQLEEVIERRATAFAVYVGSNGVINWVEREVRLGLSRATGTQRPFPFIPILAAPAQGFSALPGFARQFQGVSDVENRPDEFQKLMAGVLGADGAGQLSLEAQPFFGLEPIDENRSYLFFGREAETQKLVDLLRDRRLLMITGDSGSGKSSLAHARLVPRWRGGLLSRGGGRWPSDEIWHVVKVRPRANPRRALGDAVFQAAAQLGRSAEDCGTFNGWVRGDDAEQRRNGLRCGLPAGNTRTLLVVDQLEELLTLTPREQRGWFVDLLLELADPGDEAFAVVLTMRHDYYNLCSEFPPLFERLESQQRRARYLLGRMSDDDLHQVITKPLELAGVSANDRETLARGVLQDVGERPGDLALMQFALTEAWSKRASYDNDLLSSYVGVGRVEGALAGAAERVYQELGGDANQSTIEAIFVRLVRLGDTGGATRRIARRDEFDDERWALLQKLATTEGNRLVLTGGSEQNPVVEIAHEALSTQWPRFQGWLQASAGDKRTLDALIERVAVWKAAESVAEKNNRLATGAERGAFDQLALRRPEWMSADEQAFVSASRDAYQAQIEGEQRSRNRLRRLTRIAVAAAALLAVVAAAAAWQWRIANAQRNRAEAAVRDATDAANSLIFDMAQRFRDRGLPVAVVRDILDQAQELQSRLIATGEVAPDLRRGESAALNELVTTLLAQGETESALTAAKRSLSIIQGLAASSPGNAGWQRDLSVSYDKVGNVLVAQGNLPEALKSYRDCLAIIDRLAKADPGNAGWQRDLSVSYNKVGDVLVAQGNLPEALKSYRDSLAIRDRLAKADPGNAGWQRDLIVSLFKLGNVGNDSRACYTKALAIARQLDAAGKLTAAQKPVVAELEQRIARLPK